jgi:hypothetical protein
MRQPDLLSALHRREADAQHERAAQLREEASNRPKPDTGERSYQSNGIRDSSADRLPDQGKSGNPWLLKVPFNVLVGGEQRQAIEFAQY